VTSRAMISAMRICAGGVLVRGETILLAKRSAERAFYPGVWDIIGGHCEANETPAETLVRELQEEVGIRPRTFEEIAVLDEPRPAEHGEAMYHVFSVTAWDGAEPRLLGSEHSELRWLRLDEALSLPLAHPGYGAMFRDVLARRRPRRSAAEAILRGESVVLPVGVSSRAFDALLFDLGGVVINIDFDRMFARWAHHAGQEPAAIRARFSFDEFYARHERGEISASEYFSSLRSSLRISLSDAQFVDGWTAIYIGEVPGVPGLLRSLKDHIPQGSHSALRVHELEPDTHERMGECLRGDAEELPPRVCVVGDGHQETGAGGLREGGDGDRCTRRTHPLLRRHGRERPRCGGRWHAGSAYPRRRRCS
jgi:8-oxo-dGTP diphosphatase